MLSGKQFGALYSGGPGGGGFSVNPKTGAEPSSGYMVSKAGTERLIPSSMTHPEHLEQFAKAHEGAWSQGQDYMGGWNDPGTGTVALDVSANLPSGGPVERAGAHLAMITHKQRALYHIDTDSVETNKYYGKTKPEAHAAIKSEYEAAASRHRQRR